MEVTRWAVQLHKLKMTSVGGIRIVGGEEDRYILRIEGNVIMFNKGEVTTTDFQNTLNLYRIAVDHNGDIKIACIDWMEIETLGDHGDKTLEIQFLPPSDWSTATPTKQTLTKSRVVAWPFIEDHA